MKEVTLPIPSSCFVDANIIFYIDKLKDKSDFINVLEQIYESVYIHEEVYKELDRSSQKFVDNKCQEQKWTLLNPLQEFQTTYSDYLLMLPKIQEKLIEVDKRRGKEGSVGTGEIASLAAAYMLNAEIICSNDYSLEDVIVEVPLHIFINGDEESEPVYIKHHRLIDFCEMMFLGNIIKRSVVRKFYQIAHIDLKKKDPEAYKVILADFDKRIPATLE